MFSFHKPKVYRSSSGCCICKAKSSSSRFTDSKKYESDFVECFQLQEPRSGEVCNACVLLVKRWKKLPEGSQRNWRHVVDARAGPGTKSATKFKSKQKRKMKSKASEQVAAAEEHMDEDGKKDVAMMDSMREQSPSALSDEINGGDSLSDLSVPPSPTPSEDQQPPSFTPSTPSNPHRTRSMLKRLAPPPLPAPISEFIDTDYWKREKVCCGIVFKGRHGQLLIDTRFFKPCHSRRKSLATPPPVAAAEPPQVACMPATSATTATASSPPFSDASSDSGYDESSNQSEVTSLLSIAAAAAAASAAASSAN